MSPEAADQGSEERLRALLAQIRALGSDDLPEPAVHYIPEEIRHGQR